MSEVPVQVVVAAWNNERAAGEALGLINDAKRAQLIGVVDAAVLRRDARGKLHIKDVGEVRQRRRSIVGGGIIGAIAGMLAGPLVIPTVAGALLGGLAAKLRDSGFGDPQLEAIGSALTPGSSAIVAVIEHRWVEEVERRLAEAGANTVVEALRADIAAQLEAGHDVAYTALETTGAFAAGRIAGSGDEIVVDGVVETADATFIGGAAANATGAERYSAVVSDQVMLIEGASISDDRSTGGAAVIDADGVTGAHGEARGVGETEPSEALEKPQQPS